MNRREPAPAAVCERSALRLPGIGAVLPASLILIWLLAGPTGSPRAAAQESAPPPAADNGVFDILSGQQQVGTEKFVIREISGGWVVSGELQLAAPGGGRVSETSSLTLNDALHPTFYERVQKSPLPGKLAVQFGPTETVLEMTAGEADPYQQIFLLPKDHLAVLDTNFFHHFALLLRLYDRARGATQPLNVFIPQEALPGVVNLEYLNREPIPGGAPTIDFDHFRVVTDELQIEIWASPEGAIQRLSIPQANLEVVRQ
jgi:hypothetical protein